MRLKCIACEALARPVYLCAAYSPHDVDVAMVSRGLHHRPNHLRDQLQAYVDAASSRQYDAVVLVYGLCGQATVGLEARDIPVVLPRAHDCITLFLGSRERYRQQFETVPGTFWYAQDYIARGDGEASAVAMGSFASVDLQAVYDAYVEKYGQDNADYLMEVMGTWQSHYQRAVYLATGVGETGTVESRAREEAARRGWAFERMTANLGLIRRLLAGEWDDDFLVIPPGQSLAMAADERLMDTVETRGT